MDANGIFFPVAVVEGIQPCNLPRPRDERGGAHRFVRGERMTVSWAMDAPDNYCNIVITHHRYDFTHVGFR